MNGTKSCATHGSDRKRQRIADDKMGRLSMTGGVYDTPQHHTIYAQTVQVKLLALPHLRLILTISAEVGHFGREVLSDSPHSTHESYESLRIGFIVLLSHARRKIHYFDFLALGASWYREI